MKVFISSLQNKVWMRKRQNMHSNLQVCCWDIVSYKMEPIAFIYLWNMAQQPNPCVVWMDRRWGFLEDIVCLPVEWKSLSIQAVAQMVTRNLPLLVSTKSLMAGIFFCFSFIQIGSSSCPIPFSIYCHFSASL